MKPLEVRKVRLRDAFADFYRAHLTLVAGSGGTDYRIGFAMSIDRHVRFGHRAMSEAAVAEPVSIGTGRGARPSSPG